MMPGRSFRARLILVFTAGFLMLLLVGVYGVRGYRQQLAKLDLQQKANAEQLRLVKDIQIHYSQQNLAWANILLRGDEPAQYHHYLSAFYENERQTLERARQLQEHLETQRQPHTLTREFVQRLQQLRAQYRAALRMYNAAPDTPQTTDRFLSAITQKPTEMLEAIEQQLLQRHAALLQEIERSTRQQEVSFFLITTGILVALLLVFLWFIDRNFARPIAHAIETARQVAAGKVSQRIQVTPNEEFGAFAAAFNFMLEKLAQANAELAANVSQLRAEIAHREQVERTLRAEQQALAAANSELEAFSYSVSHDLRAPLRGIDGYCHVLIEDYGGQLDASGQKYLQQVRSGAQTMGVLIDDLLKLSRVTRTPLQRKEIDLSAIAREVVAHLQRAEPEREIRVALAEGLRAYADPGLLRIALENLLGNAWKYTSKTVAAQLSFDAVQLDGETTYRVRDNGAGFEMQYANKLFSAFQRLHRAEDFPGTGIGLATVARIIRRHGGRIWAEAEPEHGATFWFTLAAE